MCGLITRSSKISEHQRSYTCRIRCHACGYKCRSKEALKIHQEVHVLNLEYDITDSSEFEEQEENPELEEDELINIYKTFNHYIRSKIVKKSTTERYNIKLSNFSNNELAYHFNRVFREQKTVFKVNISMGLILQNKETGEHRYHWPSNNNQLIFDKPTTIRNTTDKNDFIEELLNTSLIQRVNRPSSKWVFIKASNVTFFIYKLKNTPIGGTGVDLPNHLLKNKGLNVLIKNRNSGKVYQDKKCFFRCLALHKGYPITALEKPTDELMKEYCLKASIKKFKGVRLDQLDCISKLFDVSINVYQQNQKNNTKIIFRSTLRDEPMNINLCIDHFSYIKNMSLYSKSYCCPHCKKFWKHSGTYNRHIKTCKDGIKEDYCYGSFRVKPTIFDQLADIGIEIPQNLRIFPYRATFDIECMLKPISGLDTNKMTFSTEHELVSISICSNVEGYTEPNCFVVSEDGQKSLVKAFLEYLMEISDQAASLMEERFDEYMEEIDNSSLSDKFNKYIAQLPVISFNGARYDLKVLKQYLIPLLVETGFVDHVIRKGTGYMSISTEQLRFLDIMFYIAPGFSYDKFLKAYGATLTKSYFPYEYLDSLEKLDCPDFPSYHSFYSTLKDKNTLEEGQFTAAECNILGRTPNPENPPTRREIITIGHHRYQILQDKFYDNNWTIRDYLIYYNNMDVVPFLTALSNLSRYYEERKVDVFKEALSGIL